MSRNRNAEMVLVERFGYGQQTTENIVHALIEGGFIPADSLTEPERFAQAARDWVRGDSIFMYAVGWSVDSWKTVLDETWEDYEAEKYRSIFRALVILAKEEGIEL